MQEAQKRKRRKKRRLTGDKQNFWGKLVLYFLYFSAIFLLLYYLFDRSDMLLEIKKDPDIFCWKVFGSSLLFALGTALWMQRDPKLTGK